MKMGKLKKNDDGTYSFKKGFSTENPEDMDQLKNLMKSENR